MSDRRFMSGYPAARLERDSLLFDGRRLADISFPLRRNFAKGVLEGHVIPVGWNQEESGWDIQSRNLGGGDIAYVIPGSRINGLSGRALIAGGGASIDETKNKNMSSKQFRGGINLGLGELNYQKKIGNTSINAALEAPRFDLGVDATRNTRQDGPLEVLTGVSAHAAAKATAFKGKVGGRIEIPLAKTFNAPFWKIPSNIKKAWNGERKARPGDAKLVLSGSAEAGAGVGGDVFLQLGRYEKALPRKLPGGVEKVARGMRFQAGGSGYFGVGGGLSSGVAIEWEPDQPGEVSSDIPDISYRIPQFEAAELLFNPNLDDSEQAFTPIDEIVDDNVDSFELPRNKLSQSDLRKFRRAYPDDHGFLSPSDVPQTYRVPTFKAPVGGPRSSEGQVFRKAYPDGYGFLSAAESYRPQTTPVFKPFDIIDGKVYLGGDRADINNYMPLRKPQQY